MTKEEYAEEYANVAFEGMNIHGEKSYSAKDLHSLQTCRPKISAFLAGWDKCVEIHHKTKTVDQRLLERIQELEAERDKWKKEADMFVDIGNEIAKQRDHRVYELRKQIQELEADRDKW